MLDIITEERHLTYNEWRVVVKKAILACEHCDLTAGVATACVYKGTSTTCTVCGYSKYVSATSLDIVPR